MKREEAFPNSPRSVEGEAIPENVSETDLRMLDAQETCANLELAAAVLNHVADIKRKAKDYERRAEEALMAYILRFGGFTLGNTRYYSGVKTVHRCHDNRKAFAAILEACGGDLERVVDTIRSGGIKAGASKALLGDKFNQFFSTEKIGELKYGAPSRRLQKAYTLGTAPQDTGDDDAEE